MDEPRVAQVAHDDQDREDRLCYCYGGYHYIGHMAEETESGEEAEVFETVPCRRCSDSR